MTQNDIEREIYEGRIKARRDENSRLRGARQEGRLIERILVGQRLQKMPLTPEEELYEMTLEQCEVLAEQVLKQAPPPA